MKAKRIILMALISLAGMGPAAAGTNDVSALLQKGLFEEEANHNLDAAMDAYRAVVAQTDRDRQFAATAIFRLGECYRKQGKTNEAGAQYQRILREFPEQAELVNLSWDHAGNTVAAAPEANRSRLLELHRQVAAAKAELLTQQTQLAQLEHLGPEKEQVYAQQHFSNPVLDSLMQKLNTTEQELAGLKVSRGEHHPEVEQTAASLKAINQQIAAQVDGIRASLAEKIIVNQSAVAELEKQIDLLGMAPAVVSSQPGPANGAPSAEDAVMQRLLAKRASESAEEPSPEESTSPVTRRLERNEIARLQAMIKDSPDLINTRLSPQGAALGSAVKENQLAVVKFLLDNKADIELRDDATRTPLQNAAGAGNREMVELLLSRGADANAVQTKLEGFSALHYAAGMGYKSVVEALLAHGANPNSRDVFGQTPLMLAAAKGFRSVAETLLAGGADVSAADKKGATALFAAVGAGHKTTIELLLAHGADINATNSEGTTALFTAITGGNKAVIELLLNNKADVNFKTKDGFTPLIAAVNAGQTEAVKLLLEHGADARSKMAENHESTPRWTALDAAVLKDDNVSAKLLLEHQADPNATFDMAERGNIYERDSTPLILAAGWGHREPARTLLAHKADVNAKDAKGWTALLKAVVNRNDREMATLLLDNGADPEIKLAENGDPASETALQWAVRNNKKEMAEVLLAHGAKVNAPDSSGDTPLHRAAAAGLQAMVELLLAHGADVNAKDDQGNTPLDLTVKLPGQNFGGPLILGLGGRAGATYPLPPGQPGSGGGPEDVAGLLRRHGAVAETDVATIRTIRQGMSVPTIVFRKDHGAHNHQTLFELIASIYAPPTWNPYVFSNGHRPPGMQFPDLSHVTIHRQEVDGHTETQQPDLAGILIAGDCTRDISLKWGDVVEIPEADHVVTENWTGLEQPMRETLKKCLQRKVEIIVKGKTTRVTLTADLPFFNAEGTFQGDALWHGFSDGFHYGGFGQPHSPGDTAPKTELWSFWLNDVVRQANVILTSSDLTRVKVKRFNPATQKTEEMVFDLEKASPDNDLWLRDGDVIEVPEKK